MVKMVGIISIFFLVGSFSRCEQIWDNPFDEGGSNYQPPAITIDYKLSTVKNNDTIHFDSATVVLIGNKEQSRFRIKLDKNTWPADWKPEGAFGIDGLKDGNHTLIISTMYDGGEKKFYDTISFHVKTKGYRPEFPVADDSTITSDTGMAITITVSATGASPMSYWWIKNKKLLNGRIGNTLKIDTFAVTDTGLYRCVVSNEYGVDTSRIFVLKFKPSIRFNVIYNDNNADSGKVPVDKTNYKFGMKVTVLDNSGKLQKTGHTFSGWSRSKEGKEPVFDATDTFSMGQSNDTLYAVWNTNQYTLSFKGNGNTSGNPPEAMKRAYNTSVIIPGKETLERPGYVFSGWNTDEEGRGEEYSKDATLTMPDSDVVLYAKWETLPTFKVTYEGNGKTGGSVPADTNEYYEGQKVTVMGNPGNLEKTDFRFAGWNTTADGTWEDYNAGSTFSMPSSAVTLYAKWTTEPTYTLSYDGNGATGGKAPDMVNFKSGATVTLADSGSLYKTGYSFSGWDTQENGSGKTYKAGDKNEMDTVSITLYAQWTESKYTITYHGNGNIGGTVPPKTTHLYQTEITIAGSGDLGKTGHSFVGWNTDSAGNGLDYQTGDKILSEKNVHLYARWIKKKYQITFSGNGDRESNVPDITEFEYGLKIDSVSFIPSRQSYTFDGWCRNSLCTDKWKYTTDSIIASDTLYARWIIIDVDGNIYTEVKLGNQVWMVENLKVTKYRDGIPIPKETDQSKWPDTDLPVYCWYNNDSAAYKNPYGAMYNWYVVNPENPRKVAPEGWHVPSDSEWIELVTYLSNNGYNFDGSSTYNLIAKSLATTTKWNTESGEGKIGCDLSKNNRSGFSAYPSGKAGREFCCLGNRCNWWSTTENDTYEANYPDEVWHYSLDYYYEHLERWGTLKWGGESIRCVRDW